MSSVKCLLFCLLSLVNLISAAHVELSEKQELDIIKYIEFKIDECEIHDVETLNACILNISMLLKPYMRYGLKAWDVPVLEPMFLRRVHLKRHAASTRIDATFEDVLVHGLSNYEVTYLKTYPEEYRYEFKLLFPMLKIMGIYDIDGKILLLELKDHGPFIANLTHVEASVEGSFHVEDGHLNLYKVNSDFTFKKFRFHLDNLLRGSPLGESVNKALNEDVDSLLKELKPAMIEAINKIAIQTFQRGLQSLPLSKWKAAFTTDKA